MKKFTFAIGLLFVTFMVMSCVLGSSPINIEFDTPGEDENIPHGETVYVRFYVSMEDDEDTDFWGMVYVYVDNEPIDTIGYFQSPYSVQFSSSDYQLGDHVIKVVAEVDDDRGQKEITVTFTGNAPEAAFTVTPGSGSADLTFVFNANSSTDVEDDTSDFSYQWDFDDDGDWDGCGMIACYQFADGGNHDVKLRVTDTGGAYGETTERVSVSNPSGDIPEGYALMEDGTFMMFGTRQVTLTKDLYVGKNEVMFADFIEFLNDRNVGSDGMLNGNEIINPNDSQYRAFFLYTNDDWEFEATDYIRDDTCPVCHVAWYGALEYCNWLSEQDGLNSCYTIGSGTSSDQGAVTCDWNANGYRLPTEAEWEFAAIGGNLSYRDFPYAGSYDRDAVAVYNHYSNVIYGEYPVGERLPNELGIYDMSGNASEWCWDWVEWSASQPTDIATDPIGSGTGTSRIVRGGHYSDVNPYISSRESTNAYGKGFPGFRVVRIAQ